MAKKILLLFIATVVVVSAFIFITCTPPTNPFDDPSNFVIKVAAKDTSTIYAGKKAIIGFHVNIPKYLKSFKVTFGEGTKDTTFEYTNQSYTSSDIVYLTCIYDTSGDKNITVFTSLTNGTIKQFYGLLTVAASPISLNSQSIVFDSIPDTNAIAVNTPDSLRFIAHTEPGDSSISYSVTSIPVIMDTVQLKIKTQNRTIGSAAIVYITPPDTGKYIVTLQARSGSIVDSQKVVVYALKAPVFSQKPADSTNLYIGKSDTLVFTVNKLPDDSIRLQFKNQSDFKTGTVAVLSSQPDTLKILFTPDEAKEYVFIVAATGKHLSNSIQVIRNVLSDTSSFWKQSPITVNAVEGVLLQTDLKTNFTDTTMSGVTYTTDKGEIVDNTLKHTVPSGKTTDTVNVMVQYKGVSSKLQVVIQISAELPFWKQTSAIISGVEGILLQQNLASFLTDSTIVGVTYVTSKGQISDRLINYTAPFGKTADTLGVTATRAEKPPAQIELIVQIASSDSSKPSITRKTPSSDDFKSSTSQVTCEYTITDEGARVGSVVFSIGDSVLTDTTHIGNVYGCTIKNLTKDQKTTVTVVAKDASIKKNSTSASVSITYDPTMTDNIGPEIIFLTKDSSKVSSPSKSIDLSCTDSSGIASLLYLYGAAPVNVPKNTDGTFSANVSGLAKGENIIVFTATDGSANANASKDTIMIFYDPTMEDVDPPTINLKSPANADQRVETDSVVVKIACSDLNGVASVTAARAGNAVIVTGPEADSLYSAVLSKLTPGGSDTLIFTVTDKSTKANSKPFTVILRYNRKPNSATLSTPAANATSVALKPTFIWTDGTDPDGDAVTYTLKYGTTQTNLNQSKAGITANQYTLANDLIAATDYYWLIMTITANGDSIASDLHKFTTVDAAPRISADPEPIRLRIGNTATFSIIATGSNPKYQWQKGAANVTTGTGATTPTYTTAAMNAGDDGSTYRCIVTNDGGADTSTPATLTIVHSVIYNENGKSGGSVPTDGSTYADGEPVTVKLNSGSLVKTGYTFAGWNSKADGTGTDFPPGSGTFIMSTGDVVIYAKWAVIPYSITYILDGSTYSGNPSSYTVETATFNLPRPTKAGYLFSEWYSASDLSGTAITSIPKGTIGIKNFYAKWLTPYTVTYDPNGGGIAWGHGSGGTVPVDIKEYSTENTVTVLGNSGNLTKYAYVFDGWSRTRNGQAVTSFAMGNKNDTLYARWVIKDASGNIYTEVIIMGQVWMVENLRTTKYNDNTDIPLWNIAAYDSASFYPGDQTYGAYYNGHAVAKDANKLLPPPGWHLATTLDYAGFQYGTEGKAKYIASKEYWKTGSSTDNAPGQQPSLNNSSGFSAVPAGYFSGIVRELGESAAIWMNNFITDEYGIVRGSTINLNWDSGFFSTGTADMNDYHSVRCLRDSW